MVTKRTPIKRATKMRISSQSLDAYARVNQFLDEAHHTDDFREAELLLDQLLRRQPWQETISGTFDQDEPPDWLLQQGEKRIRDWLQAKEIREQLDNALVKRGWPKAPTL